MKNVDARKMPNCRTITTTTLCLPLAIGYKTDSLIGHNALSHHVNILNTAEYLFADNVTVRNPFLFVVRQQLMSCASGHRVPIVSFAFLLLDLTIVNEKLKSMCII